MKKKILSLLLSATLIFSMFSLTAFAQETTKTEQCLENGLQEFYSRITLYDDYNMEIDSYDIYLAGNKASIKNITLFDNFKIDCVYNGNKVFIYPSGFPFIHFQVEDDFSNDSYDSSETNDFSDKLTFVKSYEQKINSTVYYVEEFNYEDPEFDYSSEIQKYCFLGDELKLIIQESEDQITHTEIVSTDVDDNVFELPFFSINLTPFFKIIAGIFDIIIF